MADEDDDLPQDETPEPDQRLFTLTEPDRARRENEPFPGQRVERHKTPSGSA